MRAAPARADVSGHRERIGQRAVVPAGLAVLDGTGQFPGRLGGTEQFADLGGAGQPGSVGERGVLAVEGGAA